MTETLTADYVVVGTGAGGGPVAVRLVEAGFSVIAIEAGSDPPDDLTYLVPAFHAYASEAPDTAWNFFVRHYDDAAQATRDPKYTAAEGGVLYPRCSTVGGCTAHNALIVVRPNDSDWDAIAELTGDPSWAASRMVGYFTKLERCRYRPWTALAQRRPRLGRLIRAVPVLGRRFEPDGHGFEGWLPTSLADPLLLTRDPQLLLVVLTAIWRQLRQTLDRRFTLRESLASFVDPNRDAAQRRSLLGVWLIPLAAAQGRRHGTREPLARHDGGGLLTLLTSTLATGLELDDAGRCTGVHALRGLHLYRADPRSDDAAAPAPEPLLVRARREVILAGGAFNTPQLLQLSGIGPTELLDSLGVGVRVASPGVGANLQDRYEVGVVAELDRPFALVEQGAFHPPLEGEPPDPALQQWFAGKGPYKTNGAVIAAMVKSSPQLAVPDLFVFGLPADFRGYHPGYSRNLELTPNRLTWAVLKAHTKNRAGVVRAVSTDPRDVPDITFRYFEEGSDASGADLDAVVAGVRFVREVNARLGSRAREIWPGPHVETDESLRTWVRDVAWGHHACGTCAMGPADDPTAVLDSRFRVRGVPGLRVVDASVFPTIPGYFLVSAVFMISEKAADVILLDADDPEAVWPAAPLASAVV